MAVTGEGCLWCLALGCWQHIIWVLWVMGWGHYGLDLFQHIPQMINGIVKYEEGRPGHYSRLRVTVLIQFLTRLFRVKQNSILYGGLLPRGVCVLGLL